MTYQVGFAGSGALQFHEMPAEAQDALIVRAAELAEEPWDAQVDLLGDDPSFRITEFGESVLVRFQVDEANRTIGLYDIVWAG